MHRQTVPTGFRYRPILKRDNVSDDSEEEDFEWFSKLKSKHATLGIHIQNVEEVEEEDDDDDEFLHVFRSRNNCNNKVLIDKEVGEIDKEIEAAEDDDEEEEESSTHGNSISERGECLPVISDANDPPNAFWEGHLVSKYYVDLLTKIKCHHPQTFNGAKFSTVAVDTFAYNFLGEFYTSLAKKRLVDVDHDDIAYLKHALTDLETFNFNVEWLRKRVGKIEEVKFVNPLVAELNDLKKRAEEKEKELAKVEAELDELKRRCGEKAEEVKDVHGDLGEKIDTMCLADGLLPKKRRLRLSTKI